MWRSKATIDGFRADSQGRHVHWLPARALDIPMHSLNSRNRVEFAILALAVALFLWGLVIALGDGFIIHTSLGTFSSRRPSRPFLAAAEIGRASCRERV